MRLLLDDEAGVLTIDGETVDLHTPEAFAALSRAWLRLGWGQRHSYGFTWLGRPLIQLPEDALRYQEVVWRLRPDVIVETGIAHGGSLALSASVLELLGHGHVVGVDIDIRPPNRAALDAHPLRHRMTLLEGSSTDPVVLARVRAAVGEARTVLVVLDSDHSRAHVRAELEAYAPLVTPGSWIVATDGIMRDLDGVPGAGEGWARDNPAQAARDFLAEHPEFELAPPERAFDETRGVPPLTYWPDAWLRRTGSAHG